MIHEKPITPDRIHFDGGIPDYELGRLIWREVKSYYDPLAGDEDSAIQRYSERWGLDSEEVRRVIGGRALASEATLNKLGLYSRNVDGRCTNCSKATTIIHYFEL